MTAVQIIDLAIKILIAFGGLGGLGAFLMVRTQKRKIIADSGKTDAEADHIVADAQNRRTDREARILDMSEQVLTQMAERLDEANDKIDRLTNYVEVLVQALRAAGAAVPAMPPRMAENAHRDIRARNDARPFVDE